MSARSDNHNPRYRKVGDLGSGTFGSVQLARDNKRGHLVAVKLMKRGPTITEYVLRELINHSLLWHPHVIKFQEVFLTPRHLAIVMEYADGGNLFDYVASRKRLDESTSKWLFQQLIVAVDYLHRKNIAARDIKLENTLLCGQKEKPLIKLCDFGYSKHCMMDSVPNSAVGTPAYMAPEVISTLEYDGKTADVWSCGVMLYVMLVGQYPFERPSDRHLSELARQQKALKRTMAADYVIPSNVVLSSACRDLLARMLTVDPRQRITVEQIQRHVWFLDGLPEGVLNMNDRTVTPRAKQSEEQLRGIVAIAQRPLKSHGVREYDDYAAM